MSRCAVHCASNHVRLMEDVTGCHSNEVDCSGHKVQLVSTSFTAEGCGVFFYCSKKCRDLIENEWEICIFPTGVGLV